MLFALLAFLFASHEHLIKVDEIGYQKLLDSRKGNVILVDFWATWCEPCRKELPELVRLQSKLQAQRLKLIVISADEPEQEADARRLLKKLSIPPPAYLKQPKNDNAFINAIDPKWSGALPALFLYDRQGRRARSFIGETPMAEVEAAVGKLL